MPLDVGALFTMLAAPLLDLLEKKSISYVLTESPVRKAITSTSESFSNVVVMPALLAWCGSEDFLDLLNEHYGGNRPVVSEEVVKSFVRHGQFYFPGSNETRRIAEEVLVNFFYNLAYELYKGDGGIPILGARMEALFEQQGSSLEVLLQTLSNARVIGVLPSQEISSIQDGGIDIRKLINQASHLTGPRQQFFLALLESETGSLHKALSGSATGDSTDIARLRLAVSLVRFWEIRGLFTEGRAWLDQLSARFVRAAPPDMVASALVGAGLLAYRQADYPAASLRVKEGARLARESSNTAALASALNILGMIDYRKKRYRQAHARFERSLEYARISGDGYSEGYALFNLARIEEEARNYTAAKEILDGSLSVWTRLDDTFGIPYALNEAGILLRMQGRFPAARKLHEEGLTLDRALGNTQGIAFRMRDLGLAAYLDGDPDLAEVLFKHSLVTEDQLGDRRAMAVCLERLAALERSRRRVERSVFLSGAANAMRKAIGSPRLVSELVVIDRGGVTARTPLRKNELRTASLASQIMTTQEIVDIAVDEG